MKLLSFSAYAILLAFAGLLANLPEITFSTKEANIPAKPLGYYSGSWPANSGYHSYGYTAIDATGIPNDGNISINFGAYDVPNKFAILDDCGMGTGVDSGWQGQATYPGPWGMSLANASSGTLTIKKKNNCNSYRFTVETVTSSASGSDSWQVTN